jgi:hypothetical protein
VLTPGRVVELVGGEPTAIARLVIRFLGVRDIFLGVGTLVALAGDTEQDLRRWLWAVLAADSADVALSASSAMSVGIPEALVSGALSLGFVGLDRWSLKELRVQSAADTSSAPIALKSTD